MDPTQLKELLATIVADLNMAADFVGVIDPALIPFIAIGKAMDELVPGMAASVQAWIAGNAPTPEELADFVAKLSVLNDPNAP